MCCVSVVHCLLSAALCANICARMVSHRCAGGAWVGPVQGGLGSLGCEVEVPLGHKGLVARLGGSGGPLGSQWEVVGLDVEGGQAVHVEQVGLGLWVGGAVSEGQGFLLLPMSLPVGG